MIWEMLLLVKTIYELSMKTFFQQLFQYYFFLYAQTNQLTFVNAEIAFAQSFSKKKKKTIVERV